MTTKNLTHEQAFKEAEEYVILGKDKTAFKLLHDFIISAKRRGQWTIVFEKIMTLYLNLAIKLGNFSMIRDGLAQYRYMSQTSNINSLELIIIYYRDRMESLFYEKLARFSEGKLIEMEDIDNEDSPENLFLTSIDLKSKCEREEIKSFMKNLWDSYKIIIEIVRTNNKLEEILTTTSDKIFAFCQKFKRKVEFKRFSESLRYYVSKIIKNMALYPDYLKNPFAVDITENETNERYLTIFSQQMKTALNLKLWQEAFKICEDMNAIIKIRRGVLKPKFLSNYFENLAKVFWNSEYYLYHANAFYSHYTIYKKFSKANTTEITNKTSLLVLSILSIPPFTIENEQKEENRAKIANLLSSSGTLPKRNELINIMKSTNLLELVNPEILSVFQLLEEEFDLLNFSMKAEKLFEILSQTPEYSIYIPALKVNLVYKTLLSLREVYKTITIAKLHKILHIIDLPIIENIILMAHVQEFINVKINHNLNVLIFGSNEQNSGFFLNERLNILANGLQNLRNSLGVNIAEEKSKEKQVFLKENAKKYLNESGRSLEMRKIRINKPEINQRFQKEKQKEDEDRRFIDEQKREEIEKIRIKEEQKKQKEKDIKESELNRKVKLLSELIKAKGPQVVKINGKKLESYNREELAEIEMKDLEDIKAMMQTKEKENTESKHKRTFQKVDFTERVKREGEFSIIEGFWQSDNQEVSELIKKAAEEYKRNFEIRRNLVETNGFRMNYVKENLEKRKSAYEKDLAKFRKDIEKEFKQSVLERALELLEKQKKRDDEEKKKREEAEKIRLLEEQKFKKVLDENKDTDIWRKSRPKGEENANRDRDNRDNQKPETEEEKGIWRTADKKPVAVAPKEERAQNKVIESDGWRTERQKVLNANANKEASNAKTEISKAIPSEPKKEDKKFEDFRKKEKVIEENTDKKPIIAEKPEVKKPRFVNLEGNAPKEREKPPQTAATGKFGFKSDKTAPKKEEPTGEPGPWRSVKK